MTSLRIRRVSVGSPNGGSPFRVLFASDLHLGLPWTRSTARDLSAAVYTHRPEAVLLGGDLVDGSYGLAALRSCVSELARTAPVLVSPGNHDTYAGIERVRAAILESGGKWLPDGDVGFVRATGPDIRIVGTNDGVEAVPQPAPIPGREPEVALLCTHRPEVAARAEGYCAAFAGHLHGAQWCWFRRGRKLFPGAWIWPYNGLAFRAPGVRLFVSLGAGETVPMRIGCPRDVVVCDIDRFTNLERIFSGSFAGLTSGEAPAVPPPLPIDPRGSAAKQAGAGIRS